MGLKSIIRSIDGLFAASGADWFLHLSCSLTEPICPSVSITPEGWRISRYRADFDQVEETVAAAIEQIRQEVIERKVIGHMTPYSESDDSVFEQWLHERAGGSDKKLYEMPPYPTLPDWFEGAVDDWLTDAKRGDQSASPAFWAGYVISMVCHEYGEHRARFNDELATALVTPKVERWLAA